MQRLDRLEKENSQLKQEVNQLRTKRAPASTPVAVAPAPAPAATPAEFKGNPVLHGAVAATPAPKPFLSIGGQPIITKAPGGWWVDNTTVTIYGHVDVSGDVFNVSVYDQGTKFGIASNSSYFGIRARHNLAPYGYEGYAFLAQFESQVDVASSPTEKAAFGTRDSFVGIEGPYGTIKAGKADTPYKKATAAFDPFANTVADYNSMMGNTGGDNRAEFDWRMNHAVWYKSPIWKGFQFSAHGLARAELRAGQQRLLLWRSVPVQWCRRRAAAAAISRIPAARFPAISAAMAVPTAPSATPTARRPPTRTAR